MSQFKQYTANMTWDQRVNRQLNPTARPKVSNPTGFQADSLRINATRIKNGEKVGEHWLKGRLKKQLLQYTDLTENDFKKYVEPTAKMQYATPYNYNKK